MRARLVSTHPKNTVARVKSWAIRSVSGEAIELLQSAKRPIVVVGNGAYSVSREGLQHFLEVTHLPLFTEMAARGIVPDTHPYCFGLADGRANPVARSFLKDADTVLFLGKKLDPEARVIQVEPSSDLIGLSCGVDVAILGDVGAVVKRLAQGAEGYQWGTHLMRS